MLPGRTVKLGIFAGGRKFFCFLNSNNVGSVLLILRHSELTAKEVKVKRIIIQIWTRVIFSVASPSLSEQSEKMLKLELQ